MADAFAVAQAFIAHAVRVHRDAVAIIAYYGSRANGTASPTSDLDLFYIPDGENAESLSSQFILDGLPYDFWPLSWRVAEQIANAESERPWAFSAPLIADAQVLHSRSPEDLARFNGLKSRIAELTTPEYRGFMVAKALDDFRATLFHLGQMRLAIANGDVAGLQWAGFELVSSAVNCLSLANQTYFRQGWRNGLSEVLQMPRKPAGFEGMLTSVMMPTIPEVAAEQAERLVTAVREVLADAQRSLAELAEASAVFKDFYFFVYEYVGKIVSACEREQRLAATSAALQLQREICQMMNKVTHGFYGSDFNLLGEYADPYRETGFPDLLSPASRGDLTELAARVRQLDVKFRGWLERQGVDLSLLADEDDLQRFLDRRDPG